VAGLLENKEKYSLDLGSLKLLMPVIVLVFSRCTSASSDVTPFAPMRSPEDHGLSLALTHLSSNLEAKLSNRLLPKLVPLLFVGPPHALYDNFVQKVLK
jgi:hypothetical protein